MTKREIYYLWRLIKDELDIVWTRYICLDDARIDEIMTIQEHLRTEANRLRASYYRRPWPQSQVAS